MNTTENFKLKTLQDISNILEHKISILIVKSTLNNVYVTATNIYGNILFARSGGSSKITSSKRNTTFNTELVLGTLVQKLSDLNIKFLILKLDFSSVKKKKTILKVLQRFNIKILGIHLNVVKAFNGVRPCKRRRI